MTILELVQRATTLSGVKDGEIVAEPLLPIVFEDLAVEVANDSASLPRKVKTLAFVNGTATVPADVLTKCLYQATLTDPSDNNKRYSLFDVWSDFIRTRLGGGFFVNESTITIMEPNEIYAAGGGTSGDRTLTTPCVWEIPTDAVTDISIRTELLDRLVEKLAEAIRIAST